MRQATLLAPVSRSTADHIAHLFDVGTDRMHVVPAAVADTFVKRDAHAIDAFRLRHELPEHFWLLVTAPYAHKNHRVLLDAFATLRERHPDGWPLVIRGTLTEDALAFAGARSLGKHVRLLPRVTDDEMPLLYSAASALVFPSLFEGGGMPLMEALACGCPAVASDIPTTREFAGGAAITFDPASAGELGAAMQRVERAPELRARLATLGPVAVERLRPAAVAAACTEAYRRAVAPTR
jgi:glycosyltransferase involved in cell wall biosynthesis